MRLTIEMHDPQKQLLDEITWKGITQRSVAITYAFLIAKEDRATDWAAINAAIRNKWKGKTALERIKKRAWKIVEGWITLRQERVG